MSKPINKEELLKLKKAELVQHILHLRVHLCRYEKEARRNKAAENDALSQRQFYRSRSEQIRRHAEGMIQGLMNSLALLAGKECPVEARSWLPLEAESPGLLTVNTVVSTTPPDSLNDCWICGAKHTEEVPETQAWYYPGGDK